MSQALIVNNQPEHSVKIASLPKESLQDHQVLIRTLFSSINYKDALAVSGSGKILKKFPLVPGIDVCGEVLESKSKKFKKGDLVFQTGGDLGEKYNGGYSQSVILSDDLCLPLPGSFSPQEIMTLGTAGFTAALAIFKMELNGLSQKRPVLVTGASGGVGSFAVQILAQKGYSVTAMTGKPEAKDWLTKLGAQQVIAPDDIKRNCGPLESVAWSGCIDNVGGDLLNDIIPQVQIYGQVASIGLAGGYQLKSTVMPFILRGVNLLGVSSNNCPALLRKKIWQSLSKNKPLFLESSHTVCLNEIESYSHKILERKITGRVLVQF